ncbi:DoxX family protein [Streptomyces sp. NPDC050400]|uniref:DoxX family protein n=1 Tax=Streptomyces sp. NPDC050400 TaxID=3365610 RepID=UPI0037996FFE
MNVLLWVLQGLPAAVFAMAGVMKTTQPIDRLADTLTYTKDLTPRTVRLIGAVELAAVLGLVLPAVTGLAVVLTPLAALGLAVVMALAGTFHVRHRECSAIGMNAVLLALAVVVAWGRFGPYSF